MTHRFSGKWLGVCALALAFAACSTTSPQSPDGGDASPGNGGGDAGTTGAAGRDGGTVVDGLVVNVPVEAGPEAARPDGAPDATPDGAPDATPDGAVDVADGGTSEVSASDGATPDGDTDADAIGDVAAHTDGPSIDATGLCATATVAAMTANTTNVPTGVPPAAATYTGGTIASGTYVLTSVTHYGSQYTGPPQAAYTFDATNQTLRIVETFGGGSYYFLGLTYDNVDAHTLRGVIVCNSSPFSFSTFNWNYTIAGSTLTLTQIGSADVSVYTKK